MKVLTILLLLITPTLWAQTRPDIPAKVKLERVGDMTHFEFSGHATWEYDLKKKDKVVTLIVPRLDEGSAEKIEKHSDLLVEKVEVLAEPVNKSTIKITLYDTNIENFDYLTQEPSNLVIDLFANSEKLVKKLHAMQIERSKPKKKKTVAKKAKGKGKGKAKKVAKNQDRTPAFAEFLFTVDDENAPVPPAMEDQANLGTSMGLNKLFDFTLIDFGNDQGLEAKVIEAKGNIYLRFPLLTLPNRHIVELERFPPEYEIRPSFSDENKQARFLLHLFNTRAYAAFIKGKDLFRKTFPRSKYDEILEYVEADAWIKLWKSKGKREYYDRAMAVYRKMIERFPYSKITERTLIYGGLLAHENKDHFMAAKLLKRYVKDYGKSPFTNYSRIYLADTLAKLNNFSAAAEQMKAVINDNEEGPSIEARMRLGDVYFLKQNFRRAEKEYDKALSLYPTDAKDYANIWFNLAESQFNIAEYPASIKNYKKFVEYFPRHPYAAYALTRIGELVDILSGDRIRAQGFYNESFFRFRNEPGGVLARVRSLSQRFKGMGDQELKYSIDTIRKNERKIDLPQVDEFTAFMISDGFYWRGDFMKAANTLIDYFQRNPAPVNIQKFEKRISRSIAGEVKRLLEGDQPVTALSIIEEHQKSWLSKSRRVDVQFFRAHSVEKLGLVADAHKSYQRLLRRMEQLQGSKIERERKIFEYYPSFDSVNLRLAVTSYAMGKQPEAINYLKQVKTKKELKPNETHDYYVTLSKIAFDRKDFEQAMNMVDVVRNIPIVNKEKRDKFHVYVSRVYEKNGRFGEAIDILEKYHTAAKNQGDADQIYVLSRLFHLYKSKGMVDKAIKTGEQLLTDYEKSYDLDKERYFLGELHYLNNSADKAEKVWKDLDKKGVWAQLAKNKMQSEEWKRQADDSIKRIPAMAK